MTLEIAKAEYVKLNTDANVEKYLFKEHKLDENQVYYRAKTHLMSDSSNHFHILTEGEISEFALEYFILELEMIYM